MQKFHLKRDVAPQNMDMWKTALAGAFGPFEVQPTFAHPLQGHIQIKRVADFQFNDLHYQGQQLVRTNDNLKKLNNSYYTFGLPLSGPLVVKQLGRKYQVSPGCIYLMNQSSAYTAIPLNKDGFRSLSMSIPASIFIPKVKKLDDFYHLSLDNTPQAQLLADFISNLFKGINTWKEHQILKTSNQLVDLISLFMMDNETDTDLTPIHLVRAKNYIDQHFASSDLNADKIARAGNISTSYLYKLFSANGNSLQDYIFQQRLKHAEKLLKQSNYRHLNIEQVAQLCGFTQMSHFSRRFKQHTGISPLQYRKIQV